MRKTIIRSILTICITTAFIKDANAQLGISKEYVEPPGWSVGMNIGLCDLWSDVGTKSPIDHYTNGNYWGNPHAMGGLFARYSAHPAFAIRLGVNYGTLYANDDWNKSKAEKASTIEADAYQRYMRNLSVRSRVWETNLIFEITPRRFSVESLGARKRFQPYVMLGVAALHFKPQAKYIDRNGNDRGYVDLHDLKVEGNGLSSNTYQDAPKNYSLWQLAVPMGLGVRWDIGRRLAIGIEYMYRLTFTDYLDNVSGKYVDPALYQNTELGLTPTQAALAAEMADPSYQIDPNYKHSAGQLRGNSSNKDAYSTFGITVIFKVPSRKTPWWY